MTASNKAPALETQSKSAERTKLRIIAGITLAIVFALGFIDTALAWVALLGTAIGFAISITRYSVVVGSILVSPLVLACWLGFSAYWTWPILGFMAPYPSEEAIAGPMLNALFGGALISSLIPFAAARWTGKRLPSSIMVALLGWACTGAAAYLLFQIIDASRPPHLAEETWYHLKAINYSMHLNYNSITAPRPAHVRYEGTLSFETCAPRWGKRSDTIRIPPPVRQRIEALHENLPDRLRQWFDAGSVHNFCSTNVHELADTSIEVIRSCKRVPPRPLSATTSRDASRHGIFLFDVPSIHLQGPALIPGDGSHLLIEAPSGCLLSTYPSSARVSDDDQTEILRIEVGFPRSNFDLLHIDWAFAEPWMIEIQFLKNWMRGSILQVIFQSIVSWPAIVTIWILSTLSTVLLVCGSWSLSNPDTIRPSRFHDWVRIIRRCASPRMIVRNTTAFVRRRGLVVRWSLITIGVICFLLLITLILGAILLMLLEALVYLLMFHTISMFEPTYHWIEIFAVVAVVAIEAVAFVIRRIRLRQNRAAN